MKVPDVTPISNTINTNKSILSNGYESVIDQLHVDHGLMDQFMKHTVNFKGEQLPMPNENIPTPVARQPPQAKRNVQMSNTVVVGNPRPYLPNLLNQDMKQQLNPLNFAKLGSNLIHFAPISQASQRVAVK